ncbi:hypothetical protein PCI56_16915 [Plesiomonas shigelloides subsp. oncorhynchi]|nr:hypothetical protein [Plesiomonas shigelloides]
MLFKHLSIGKKLTAAFSLLCLLIIGIGLFSLLQFTRLNAESLDLTDNVMPSIRVAAESVMKWVISAAMNWACSWSMTIQAAMPNINVCCKICRLKLMVR